jgi:phenylalanyl-tRNA synthetase beta chain
MEIVYSWIARHLGDLPPVEQVARDLERLGYEVVAVDPAEPGLDAVTLAAVTERRPHPVRPDLAILTLDVGRGTPATVVTGAANGRPGERVWWAPPGTRLRDGRTLETRPIAGVASEGMALAASELGLRAGPGDLWIWTGPEPAGSRWPDVMGRDWRLTLELTANLAQFAQSAFGLAGDLAALYRRPRPALARREVLPAAGQVRLEAPDRCPVYALWEAEVGPGELPWHRQRQLLGAGFRLISSVVDATNYVLMDIGQPLHAFDADTVALPVVVRLARPGERLELLDGRMVDLDPEDLVIADREKVLALAGIMGGRGSGVGPFTRRILVESAHFTAPGIYRTARRLGILSDAALRFSRGTDPARPAAGLALMEQLLREAGALVTAGPAWVAGTAPPPRTVPWRPDRIRIWLGVDWSDERMAADLQRLGFAVQDGRVAVPSDRPDVGGEQDLAEEIMRLEGTDAIPARLPPAAAPAAREPAEARADRVRAVMVAAGYTEVLTRALIAPGVAPRFGWPEAVHRLLNPLREEESVLRPRLLPGVLAAARYNHERQVERVAFFEVGKAFGGTPEAPAEWLELAAVLTLEPAAGLFGGDHPVVYDLKGTFETLAERLGWAVRSEAGPVPPYLHPGRALALYEGERLLGHLGELHPDVAEAWHLPRTGILWLELPATWDRREPVRRPSRFPAVRRDLSLAVPDGVAYQEMAAVITEAAGPLLEALWPFDEYFGGGGRSVAVALVFRAADRTLTDAEVDAAVARVVASLARRGVERR